MDAGGGRYLCPELGYQRHSPLTKLIFLPGSFKLCILTKGITDYEGQGISWQLKNISFLALKCPLQLPNLMCDSQRFLRISQLVPPLTLAKAAHKNEEDEQSGPLLISMLKQKCWMLKHTGSIHNLRNNSNSPYEVVLKFVNSRILPTFNSKWSQIKISYLVVMYSALWPRKFNEQETMICGF